MQLMFNFKEKLPQFVVSGVCFNFIIFIKTALFLYFILFYVDIQYAPGLSDRNYRRMTINLSSKPVYFFFEFFVFFFYGVVTIANCKKFKIVDYCISSIAKGRKYKIV